MLQGDLQHFVDPFHRADIEFFLHIIGDVRKILAVLLRNQHRGNPATVGRQKLLLQTADGQHLATQGNFPGHGHVGTHRDLGQSGHQGGAHADPGAGTILGRGAFRHMHMDVVFLVEIRFYAQHGAAAAHHRGGCLDGFLHDIAKLAGMDQPTLARHHGGFDGEQFPTHLGPGETGYLSHLIVFLGKTIAETAYTQVFIQVLRFHLDT